MALSEGMIYHSFKHIQVHAVKITSSSKDLSLRAATSSKLLLLDLLGSKRQWVQHTLPAQQPRVFRTLRLQGQVTCGSCKCELQNIHSHVLSVAEKHGSHPPQTRLQMTPSRWGIEGEGLATSVFIASRRANSQVVRLDVLDLHSLGQR